MRSLLLFLTTFISASTALICPAGFYNYTTPGGYLFCYNVFSSLYTHDQASSYCNDLGGYLAMINDTNIRTQVLSKAGTFGTVWVGVQCFTDGYCKYDDGRPFINRSFFFGGQPSPRTGNCVVMDTTNDLFNGAFVSVPCTSNSPFVCQIDPGMDQYYRQARQFGCNSIYWNFAPATIATPGYPDNYDNYQSCTYFFANQAALSIQFDSFSTESCCDFVTIYQGSDRRTWSVIGNYSGTLSKFTVNTTQAYVKIEFTSNALNVFPGFSARLVPYS